MSKMITHVYWTKEIPKKTGIYLCRNKGCISSDRITEKDLEIQAKDESYLRDGVEYYTVEPINEIGII